MNLYIRELKANLKSVIAWCLGMVIFMLMAAAKFSTFSSGPQALNDITGKLPRAARVLTGMYDFDLSAISGYYGVCFTYLILIAAIYAVVMGANIIAKEEILKTSEFLYVKPISRFKIITYKLLAALTNIIIFNALLWIISIVIVNYYDHSGVSSLPYVNKLMTGMLIIQTIFTFLGAAMSVLRNNAKKASGMATGIVLVTFFISLFISLEDQLRYFDFLSPFRYFKAQDLLTSGIEPKYVILSILIIAASIMLTYYVGNKKDLRA